MGFDEVSMVSDTISYLEHLAEEGTSTSELTTLSQHVLLLEESLFEVFELMYLLAEEIEQVKEECDKNGGCNKGK